MLLRPRFDRHVDLNSRGEFLATLLHDVELVEITESITVSRDPEDNKFLELAVSGQATHIVSGDQDLLALHPFLGIAIVTPRAYLESVANEA